MFPTPRVGLRHRFPRAAVSLLLVCLLAPALQAEQLPFKHFTPEHDPHLLSSASVQKIFQDREGYLWIGFYSSGLARYNGHDITSYGPADGLADLTVREIVQDASGHLWVGSDTGLAVSERPLSEYPPGERVKFLRSVEGHPLRQTRIRRNCLIAEPEGWIWAATTGNGIFRYRLQPGRLEEQHLAADANQDGRAELIHVITRRNSGNVWVGMADGSLIIFSVADSRVAVLEIIHPGEDGLPPQPVSSLYESPDGTLWGGGVEGLVWKLSPGGPRRFVAVNHELSARVVGMLQTPDGELWVASLGSGVLRIDTHDPSDTIHLTRRQGLLSNTLWSLHRDHEGNLWFAQNGGASLLRPDYRAFGSFTSGLPDPSVFTVVPSDAATGLMWVGTGGGIAVIDRDGNIDSIDTRDGLRDNSVYTLLEDEQGTLWAGTVGGINAISLDPDVVLPPGADPPRTLTIAGRPARIAGYQFEVAYSASSIPLRRSPGADERIDSLWFAGNSGLRALIDGRWIKFRGVTGLPGTGATGVVMDDSDYLWVATSDSGLYRSRSPLDVQTIFTLPLRRQGVAGEEVTVPLFEPVWNTSNGAPSSGVRNLLWADGNLWAGTSRGLAIIDPSSFRTRKVLDASSGLGGDVVVGTAISPSGTLWISQNAGLAELEPQTLRVVRRVTQSDGLLDNEAWAYGPIAVDHRGVVYLGTPKGLSIYRPWLDLPNSSRPLLKLERAEVRQDPGGQNEILLEYAALTFGHEQNVTYRTRLVGYDQQWSPPTSDTRIRYTNLPAFFFDRSYLFEVSASRADGFWTQPLRFRFFIEPPWWLQWWAVLGWIALLGVVVFLANHYRTKRLESRNRELRRLVDDRTAEIRSQAMELQTLDRIVQVINREVELESVLQSLLEQGMILFPQAEKSAALIFDHSQQKSEVAAAVGYDLSMFRSISFSAEQALTRYSDRSEQIQEGVWVVHDFSTLAGSEQTRHLPVPKSMMAMAVTLGGRLEAFLVFDNFQNEDAFKSSDLRKLRRYREHAVSAILKARILRELELKNNEAEQASEAKSRFLANMSHELRTPLNSIIGFSELLVERLESEIEPRYLHFLNLILTSGKHLLGIINDILDLSKVEAGKMEVFPERFNVRSAIDNVCEIMRGLSTKQGVRFEIDVPSNLPALESDPGKFKQILYNLVSNAVKFSPAGSTVRIVARQLDDPAHPEGLIEIAVTDQGIGIEPRDLEVIFEEFRQLDSTSSRQFGGTGLGLSLVTRFVRFLGGTVSAESRPGEGSTFSFRLPLRYQRMERSETPLSRLTGGGEKVLVVEDDPVAWESLSRSLESAGYLPIRARQGEEALRLARLARPVAITLDIILPGIDGWEVLKRLKESEETRAIPVVIISVTDNRELGFAMGADDYFVKPVEKQSLVRRLRELAEASPHEKPRLLLVDDDPAVHEILGDSLRQAGCEVHSAMSGQEGLSLVESVTPDVMIIDMMMPGMSGLEMAASVRRDPAMRSIPIIILTARDLSDQDHRDFEQIISGIILKGDSARQTLIDSIRHLTGRRSDPTSPEPV